MRIENSVAPVTPRLFTADEQILGETLLHHQCWCWGRDIYYPSGNLLMRHGFVRHSVPDNETGSNAYQLTGKNQEIILWGFGAFCSDGQTRGAFFARYGFAPTLLRTPTVSLPLWRCVQLPPERLPRTEAEIFAALKLTHLFLRFLIAYEKWVREICGCGWRRNCLRRWSHTSLNSTQIIDGWRKLLKSCEKGLASANKQST